MRKSIRKSERERERRGWGEGKRESERDNWYSFEYVDILISYC